MARSQLVYLVYATVLVVCLCIAQLSARPYENNANMFRALRGGYGSQSFRALKRNPEGKPEGAPWRTMVRRLGGAPAAAGDENKLSDEELVWFLDQAGRK